MKKNKGFTLIEAMIVVAILGGIFSIMPNLLSLYSNSLIQPYTSELQSGVLYARSEAVKQKTNIILIPQIRADGSGWDSWRIERVIPAAGNELLRASSNIPTSLNITSNDYTNANPISISAIGLTRTGSINIDRVVGIPNTGRDRTLNILLSGQVNVVAR